MTITIINYSLPFLSIMTTATIPTECLANCNPNENVSWLPDIDSNVTLSNFFDDIVMPDPKLRKEKIECFGCSG